MSHATTKHDADSLDALEEIRTAWNGIAGSYDRFVTASHFALGDRSLALAGLQPGMRFLDVAAGSGALSIPAARRGADVLATDISAEMVAALTARAAGEGLSLQTRVMDGHALDLGDNAFDVSGSMFGVMLFPDMPRGIGELARVTKPGGRVLMTVYGTPQKVEFLSYFVAAIQTVAPHFTGLPTDPPPLPFQLQDPARLREELEAAGLKDIRIETITEELSFRSGEALWNWLTGSNPIVGVVLGQLGLSDEQKDEVRGALDRMVRARSGGRGPAILSNPINIGVGTK